MFTTGQQVLQKLISQHILMGKSLLDFQRCLEHGFFFLPFCPRRLFWTPPLPGFQLLGNSRHQSRPLGQEQSSSRAGPWVMRKSRHGHLSVWKPGVPGVSGWQSKNHRLRAQAVFLLWGSPASPSTVFLYHSLYFCWEFSSPLVDCNTTFKFLCAVLVPKQMFNSGIVQ